MTSRPTADAAPPDAESAETEAPVPALLQDAFVSILWYRIRYADGQSIIRMQCSDKEEARYQTWGHDLALERDTESGEQSLCVRSWESVSGRRYRHDAVVIDFAADGSVVRSMSEGVDMPGDQARESLRAILAGNAWRLVSGAAESDARETGRHHAAPAAADASLDITEEQLFGP